MGVDMMEPGKLDKRITLQSPAGSRDSYGERNTTWNNVATVWASVQPLSTREQFLASQAQSSVTHKVVIRYSSTVASVEASWRVLLGSRALVVDGVRNINEFNESIELMCTEGLRQE